MFLRVIWAIIVLLIVLYIGFDTIMAMANAKSAMQASQLYDAASTTFLGLIAITLGFMFARHGDNKEP